MDPTSTFQIPPAPPSVGCWSFCPFTSSRLYDCCGTLLLLPHSYQTQLASSFQESCRIQQVPVVSTSLPSVADSTNPWTLADAVARAIRTWVIWP